MEREELYLHGKKIVLTSYLELKLQKLILLVDIVSLFVKKSYRSPSDLEIRIAHRCLKPKDTVTLGFVAHKCAKDSHHNPKIYSVIGKRTKNWFSEKGMFSEFQRCRGRFWMACHASA